MKTDWQVDADVIALIKISGEFRYRIGKIWTLYSNGAVIALQAGGYAVATFGCMIEPTADAIENARRDGDIVREAMEAADFNQLDSFKLELPSR